MNTTLSVFIALVVVGLINTAYIRHLHRKMDELQAKLAMAKAAEAELGLRAKMHVPQNGYRILTGEVLNFAELVKSYRRNKPLEISATAARNGEDYILQPIAEKAAAHA